MTKVPIITVTIPALLAYQAPNKAGGHLYVLDLAACPDPGMMVFQLADHGLGQKIPDSKSTESAAGASLAVQYDIQKGTLENLQKGIWSNRPRIDSELYELREVACRQRWAETKVAKAWKTHADAKTALGDAKYASCLAKARAMIALRDAPMDVEEPVIPDPESGELPDTPTDTELAEFKARDAA